jgi:hypothetical protein
LWREDESAPLPLPRSSRLSDEASHLVILATVLILVTASEAEKRHIDRQRRFVVLRRLDPAAGGVERAVRGPGRALRQWLARKGAQH